MIALSLLILGTQPALYQPSDKPAVMILAEVEDAGETKPKPKPRKLKPKAPAPAEKLQTPTAPLPYAPTNDHAASATVMPPIATPQVNAAPLPAVNDVPPSPSEPERLPDPVRPPERVYVYPLLESANTHEVSLRCETTVFAPNGTSTRGIVRLSLIPSQVSPGEFADIHVMAVDSGHGSIIRDTVCEAYRCSVAVTPTYYALTTMDRRKSEIKITLNRQTGAFYGYEKQSENIAAGLITLKKGVVTNESGWCVPEARGKTLF